MLALLLTLTLQGDVDRLIRDLAADDIEVRARAAERLVAAGPAARPALERAKETAGTEVRARIDDALKGIARRERIGELRMHSEARGDKALWIERAGFASAAEEGLGSAVAPEVFRLVNPALVLAYWEGDFEHLTTEVVLPAVFDRPAGGGVVAVKTMIRGRTHGPDSAWNWSTGLKDDSFKDAQRGTLDEIVRLWPQWDDACPILGIMEGIVVADDQRALRERLIEASASKRRELRIVALHALRHDFSAASVDAALAAVKHDDAKTRAVAEDTVRALAGSQEGWARGDHKQILQAQYRARCRELQWHLHELPVMLDEADVKPRILRFLEHPDPRARRDAARLAQWTRCTEAAPTLRALAGAKEVPLKEQVLYALHGLDPHGSLEVFKAALDDASAEIRRTAVHCLPNAEWKCALKPLGDVSIEVRRAAIALLHGAAQAEPLRKTLPEEKEPDARAMIAVALVLLEADATAAKLLIDETIERESGVRFDALYALNRMIDAKTFDGLTGAKYPEIDDNAKWDETVKAVEQAAGVKILVHEPTEHLKLLQGSSWWPSRLTPKIPARLREYLEDPTDRPPWTFLVEGGNVVVLPIPDAVKHWKEWRKR